MLHSKSLKLVLMYHQHGRVPLCFRSVVKQPLEPTLNTAIKTGQRILNNRSILLPGTRLNKSCSVPRSPGNTPNGKRASHQMWFSGQEEGELSNDTVSVEQGKFIILDSSSFLPLRSPKLMKITVQAISLPGLSCIEHC